MHSWFASELNFALEADYIRETGSLLDCLGDPKMGQV